MRRAIHVELMKLRRSPVGVIATAAMIGGTLAILGATRAAVAQGNPQLTAKLGPAASPDWQGLLSSAEQVVAAGGLLGASVVLAWMFAREFSDRTINGLFAVPVTRGRIALAKMAVFAGWAIIVAAGVFACVFVLGIVAGYGTPNAAVWTDLARLFALMVATAAIATPVAWVASLTRSLLAGIASGIALVIIAQVGVLSGGGGWVPMAVPALWAMAPASISPAQGGLSGCLAAAGVIATWISWRRMTLDR